VVSVSDWVTSVRTHLHTSFHPSVAGHTSMDLKQLKKNWSVTWLLIETCHLSKSFSPTGDWPLAHSSPIKPGSFYSFILIWLLRKSFHLSKCVVIGHTSLTPSTKWNMRHTSLYSSKISKIEVTSLYSSKFPKLKFACWLLMESGRALPVNYSSMQSFSPNRD